MQFSVYLRNFVVEKKEYLIRSQEAWIITPVWPCANWMTSFGALCSLFANWRSRALCNFPLIANALKILFSQSCNKTIVSIDLPLGELKSFTMQKGKKKEKEEKQDVGEEEMEMKKDRKKEKTGRLLQMSWSMEHCQPRWNSW